MQVSSERGQWTENHTLAPKVEVCKIKSGTVLSNNVQTFPPINSTLNYRPLSYPRIPGFQHQKSSSTETKLSKNQNKTIVNNFSSMASKPITIRWIRTVSQPY